MAGTGRPVGRPAKPAQVKRAEGSKAHRPLPAAPLPGKGLRGVEGIPTPPTLGKEGLVLWVHVWTAGKTWLSPDSDRTIIKMLCEAQDEHDKIRVLLSTGEVERFYATSNGQLANHPFVNQLAVLRGQMSSWLAAIGFSPADRSRLGIAEVRVRDELDDLTKRRVERAATA